MNNPAEWLLILGIVIISATFHEFMHAYTSFKLGDDTARLSGRLTLNPLAHIDPFTTVLLPLMLLAAGLPPFGAAKPVPFDPRRLKYGEWGSALVGIAGPLTSLGIAAFISLWLRIIPTGMLAGDLLELFVVVNVVFFVFNMIPFPPLDGSRVLYAVAPEGLKRLMRQVETFGILGIGLFIFLLFPILRPLVVGIISGILKLLLPGYVF